MEAMPRRYSHYYRRDSIHFAIRHTVPPYSLIECGGFYFVFQKNLSERQREWVNKKANKANKCHFSTYAYKSFARGVDDVD